MDRNSDEELVKYLLHLYRTFLYAYQETYKYTENPRIKKEIEKLRKDLEELEKLQQAEEN